jgi:hypothetical protein
MTAKLRATSYPKPPAPHSSAAARLEQLSSFGASAARSWWLANSVSNLRHSQTQGDRHGKRKQRGNREAKKPKKEKIKIIAAAPSRKAQRGSQPSIPAKRNRNGRIPPHCCPADEVIE